MSDDDEMVEVPFGDDVADTAVLLLAAAEELDLDQSEVRTVTGAFLVPRNIAEKAGVQPEPVAVGTEE